MGQLSAGKMMSVTETKVVCWSSTGQIEIIFRALHKVEVLWDDLLAVIHDEDPAYVQLDVVLSLLVLKEVKWRTLWNEEQGPELQLALNGEVLHSQMLLPVVGQALVELTILLVGNIIS